MANAKKCDRCGKFYEKSEWPSVVTFDGRNINLLVSGLFLDIDLCPECCEKLKAWWEQNKHKEDN